MVGEVDRNQHSVYRLSYHLVLVIKYRRNVINQDIFDRLIDIFENIGEKYSIECSQSNWESDHIHILFKASPQTELSKFINAYKSSSSRLIKKEHPEICEFLWKSHFWKTGYFITTTGGANIETVKKYIENQRKK
ncbi:IS200/IS605 family transposase [uncultured Methanobrevibacter sp.]|uniref:IS200/IS605 family transposase n=1 Tax=uncultured Methanobrevibacter sp. TaxID=253161 RepID=UPI0025E7D2A2|nr:IS200/IS605 family transposase [uncultured Methanobrevibacter sp.]